MNKNNDSAFFTHFSDTNPTETGKWIMKRANEHKFSVMRRFMPNSGKILEIGAGKGDFARLCIEHGLKHHSIEPNLKMSKELSKLGSKVSTTIVPPIDHPDNTFNAVYYANLLEHMPSHENAMKLISESIRVLTPGGYICIASPESQTWGMEFFNCDYTHNYPTSQRRTEQMFQNFGINTVFSEPIAGPFSGSAAPISGFFSSMMSPRVANLLTLGIIGTGKFYKIKYTFAQSFYTIGRK
jgi:SAM-dependent methyltransferase